MPEVSSTSLSYQYEARKRSPFQGMDWQLHQPWIIRSIHRLPWTWPASHRRWTQVGNIWGPDEKRTLQMLAISSAAVSVLMSLVTAYWFIRMRKRFRHNMIMLLILGDILRAISMLVLASYSLANGQIDSGSGLCQAGGFFIQFGTVMNDWSALALAVHGAAQILRPSVNYTHSLDLMFQYRHLIHAALFIIPLLCSTLNYAMPSGNYTASGAFCQLPIRPLWYRLALAWIPRYIIGISILCLSLAVYVHVRNVYRGTARSRWWALSSMAVPRDGTDLGATEDSTIPRSMQTGFAATSSNSPDLPDSKSFVSTQGRRFSTASAVMSSEPAQFVKPGEPPDDLYPSQQVGTRRASVASIATSGSTGVSRTKHFRVLGATTEDSVDLGNPAAASKGVSVRPTLERSTLAFSGLSTRTLEEKDTPVDVVRAPELSKKARAESTVSPLHVKRAIIRRQLRLTFIYPLVYVLMWLAPFVLHCMQYNNYYAKNPPFALGIVATLCYTLMAAVDCAIFCYRERPWRHIPANTTRGFWSSFICWGAYKRSERFGGKTNGGHNGCLGSWKGKHDLRRDTSDRKYRISSIDSRPVVDTSNVVPGELHPHDSVMKPFPANLANLSYNKEVSNYGHNEAPTTQVISMQDHERMGNALLVRSATPTRGHWTLRSLFTRPQRSDARRTADEHARLRLARERQERLEQQVQRLNREEATPASVLEERHWWDRVRTGSDYALWGGRRKDIGSSGRSSNYGSEKDSEAASSGHSPGEQRGIAKSAGSGSHGLYEQSAVTDASKDSAEDVEKGASLHDADEL